MFSSVRGPAVRQFGRRLLHQNAPDIVETGVGIRAVCVDAPGVANNQLATVSLLVGAGARQDPIGLGLSHAIRHNTTQASQLSSSFRVASAFSEAGAELNITTDRELQSYTLTAQKDSIAELLPIMFAHATLPKFRDYALQRDSLRTERQLFKQDSQALALDVLHAAAFRRGLGNSLFMGKGAISSFTSQELIDHHAKFYTSGNMILAANGVSSDELGSILANAKLTAPVGDAKAPAKSAFLGGEVRKNKAEASHVTIALGAPSGPTNSKQSIAAGVLASLLSNTSPVLYGSSRSPLDQAGAAPFSEESVEAFAFDYSDAGLFGIVVNARAENGGSSIRKALEAADKLAGSLTQAHVAEGVARYTQRVTSQLEQSPSNLVHHVGSTVLLNNLQSHDNIRTMLSELTPEDLKSLLSGLLKGKRAMSAVGATENVPYLDEL